MTNLDEQLSDLPSINRSGNRFGLIQLSDLQFGEKHRFGNPSKIAEKLLYDIKKMESEYDFIPLYIILSGDITEKSHSNEFNDAASVIEEISRDLKIDRRNILCVPGNHDVNWNLSKCSLEAGDDQLKFLPYNNFISNIRNNKDFYIIDCYPRIRDDSLSFKLEFLLLNSCEKEDHINHNGHVCQKKLTKTLLSKPTKEYEGLKIAILHHRLDTSISDKRSAIENASDIESILACHKYNIILTGHVHQTLVHAKTNSDGHAIIFTGCGSTGINKDEREDGVQNQYCIHVIDLTANKFQSIWRAYNPNRQTECGLGGWTKDNSFDTNPTEFQLPVIKHKPQFNLEMSTDIASSEPIKVTDTVEKNKDTGTKAFDTKMDWSEEVSEELAIAMLLGGWNG